MTIDGVFQVIGIITSVLIGAGLVTACVVMILRDPANDLD